MDAARAFTSGLADALLAAEAATPQDERGGWFCLCNDRKDEHDEFGRCRKCPCTVFEHDSLYLPSRETKETPRG